MLRRQVGYDACGVPSLTTTRESLLEAALRLLEERGPGALRIRDLSEATSKSTMGVYTHFGSKQGLLEQLYLHGFRRLEDGLKTISSAGDGRQGLLAFALAYRAFALDNEALYGLMFERATPDFVPSDDSRMAGLTTFELLAQRIAAWQHDLADPAPTAHLVWAAMHGLVSIELMHRRWGGPLVAHLRGDPEQNFATAIDSLIAGLDKTESTLANDAPPEDGPDPDQ
jgi:AcrR family transcriptional regulator